MLSFLFSNIFCDFSILKIFIILLLSLCCLVIYFTLKKSKISNNKFNTFSDLFLFSLASLWIFGIFHIHFAVLIYIIFSITITIFKKRNLLSRLYKYSENIGESNNKRVSYKAYMVGFIVNSIIMFIYDTPLYNSGYVSLIVFSNVIHATGILCAIFIIFRIIATILPYPYADSAKLQIYFVLLCIVFYITAIAVSFN